MRHLILSVTLICTMFMWSCTPKGQKLMGPQPSCVQAQTFCLANNNQAVKSIKITLSGTSTVPTEITYVFANSNNVQLFSIQTAWLGTIEHVLTFPELNQLVEGATYKIWNTWAPDDQVTFTCSFLECSTSSDPIDYSFCCDGENLISLSNFEQLANSFPGGVPSDYEQKKYFATGSISPGEYALLSAPQAANVNSNWQIKDHSTCSDNGKFLLVNGKTGQSGNKMVWRGAVSNVMPDKEYRFCAYFKNASENPGEVKPKISVKFSGASDFDIIDQIIETGLQNPCEWMEVSKVLTFSVEKSLTVWIYLDETGIGEGNDLAIDDISFQEMATTPVEYVQVNISTSTASGSYYNVYANPVNLPVDWPHFWEVCQVNGDGNCNENTKVSNPSAWFSTADNHFNGYQNTVNLSGNAPGKFLYGQSYRVKFGTWSACNTWEESNWIFKNDSPNKTIQIERLGKAKNP